MIPRHRPPFGIQAVVRSMLSRAKGSSLEQIENAYAQAAGLPHAVLLPSARAGIYWALKVAIAPGTSVICPAYTCVVVHEAIVRSGAQMRLVDTKETEFLMDDAALSAAQSGKHATVLPETYGYTYDLSAIGSKSQGNQLIRIVDMAMSVPNSRLFERLQDTDFAVVSFGIGKCMYAGWGGMGLTRDAKLADEVRLLRDSRLTRGDALLLIKRSVETLLRTAAHERIIYGVSRRTKQTRKPGSHRRSRSSGIPSHWIGETNLSPEWFYPSTYVDRGLALYNLKHADDYYHCRIALAARYHDNLRGVPGVLRPGVSPFPLSHYTIRVNSSARRAIRESLWMAGIDVGALYGFPSYLAKTDYPNSDRIASEILNLPLDASLKVEDVDRISECVVHAVTNFSMLPSMQAIGENIPAV